MFDEKFEDWMAIPGNEALYEASCENIDEAAYEAQLAKLAIEMSLLTKSKISEIKKNCLELNDKIFSKEKIFKTLISEINNLKKK